MLRTTLCKSIKFLLIHVFLLTEQVQPYAYPWLIFPPTAPTRHQLIAGIGVPLGTPESVIMGWVLKAQYFLPTNTDELKPNNWDGWNNSRRSIEKREIVTPREVKVDTEPLSDDDSKFEDADDDYWTTMDEDVSKKSPSLDADPLINEGYNPERSRWTTYKALEQIGAIYGSGGRECVLRSICEAASAEFTHTGGVFAELLHIIFSPSTTTEPISDHSDNEYYRAEQLGREGAPCHIVFHECQNTILDVFTGVHDPTADVFSLAHQKHTRPFMNQ